jgi:hypothetical protein
MITKHLYIILIAIMLLPSSIHSCNRERTCCSSKNKSTVNQKIQCCCDTGECSNKKKPPNEINDAVNIDSKSFLLLTYKINYIAFIENTPFLNKLFLFQKYTEIIKPPSSQTTCVFLL